MKLLARTKKILLKIIYGFSWLYLFTLTVLWLVGFVSLFWMVWTRNFDSYTIVWLIVVGPALLGLYSYLASYYLFHTHFWKVILLLDLAFLFIGGSILVGIVYLVVAFPLIYALFQLGFNDEAHIQGCVFNSWRRGFPAPPGYIEEIKLTKPQLEAFFDNIDNLRQQQSQAIKNNASRSIHYS